MFKKVYDIIFNKNEDSKYFNSNGFFISHEHFTQWHLDMYGYPDYSDWYDDQQKSGDLMNGSYVQNYKKYCETFTILTNGNVTTESENTCIHKWRVVGDGDVVGNYYGDFQKKCKCINCGVDGILHEFGMI